MIGTPAYFAARGVPQTPADLLAHQAIIYEQRDDGATWAFWRGTSETTVTVSGRLRVSATEGIRESVFAGSPHFTHVSVDDFRIIKENLAGGNRSTRDRLVPYCMFTDPPLAHVGLTEREAQQQGIAVRVARLPMSTVLRTHTTDETQGFMKALIGSDDRILGFTMIGSEAGEVMTAVQTAMLSGLPYQRLRDAVIAHLTVAEGLGPLLAGAH